MTKRIDWMCVIEYTIDVLVLIAAIILYDHSKTPVSWVAGMQFILLLFLQGIRRKRMATLQSRVEGTESHLAS